MLLIKKTEEKGIPPLVRYSLLVLVTAGFLTGGFVREKYIINFSDPQLPLFIERYEAADALPVKIFDQAQPQQTDPRWFTLPLYLLFYILLSACALFLIFQKKEVWIYVVSGYGALLLLSGVFLVLAKFLTGLSVPYTVAQHLKELMLSPFLTMFLIALYYASSVREVQD